MKSLIAHLGSDRFPRLRIGIGSHGLKTLVGHVLGSFSPEERPLMDAGIQQATQAIRLLLTDGFQAAANRFNTRKQKSKKEAPPADAHTAEPPPAAEP